ncbi:MAG: GAF domain-containing sensor histidine kinase [Pseudomonadales bacterium]|nr:GAF domain-containing sensor histidine kinase [Pseudomonadales bacterium]NRA14143.1 GAF domain-containing sensor histidine kinase [Oceanospirillaceae bacterium]
MSTKRSDLHDSLEMLSELAQCYDSYSNASDYLGFVNSLLSRQLKSQNYFLVLYDTKSTIVEYVFGCEQKDRLKVATQLNRSSLPLAALKHSALYQLLDNNDQLCCNWGQQLQHYSEFSRDSSLQQWLGFPLSAADGCIGALVVSSFEQSCSYTSEQQKVFALMAIYIAIALDMYSAHKSIEQQVGIKIKSLEVQLKNKIKDEKLHRALFEITSLTSDFIELKDLYPKLHAIFSTLLDASNVGILLYDESKNQLHYDYVIDIYDKETLGGAIIPFGPGMCSYVIRERRPCLFTPEIVSANLQSGEMPGVLGAQNFSTWIGAPLISANRVYGVIYVQSYSASLLYNQADLDILEFVASYVASSIEITIRTAQLKDEQMHLAEQHHLLEAENRQLDLTLKELHATEQELIKKQKMLSLGSLVSNLASEVNLPINNCLESINRIEAFDRQFQRQFKNVQLSEETLINYVQNVQKVEEVLQDNLHRAAQLINNFKKIAVDQSRHELRNVDLNNYLKDTIHAIEQSTDVQGHSILLQCDTGITITTNCTALTQILKHLVANSIKHGFEKQPEGKINISIGRFHENLIINYSDSGRGMNDRDLEHLFDPFFTSKNTSGTGLGTNLIYNLVTRSLLGKIEVKNLKVGGLAFCITFPMQLQY